MKLFSGTQEFRRSEEATRARACKRTERHKEKFGSANWANRAGKAQGPGDVEHASWRAEES